MPAYPVQLELAPPRHYDRIQLVVRIVLAIALGSIGITVGWLGVLLYLTLPIFAAIVISTRGGEAYVAGAGERVWRVIEWLLAFSAYMLLVTDRFPAGRGEGARIELRPTARPSVESALLRLLNSIPSALVLAVLWFVSAVFVVVAAITVIFARVVPASIVAYQTGIVRWQARLIAYHASIVDEYPPFSFEAASEEPDLHAAM